ncbi:hypothetical protein VOLCADRAFT_74648 [Volvox carteri f. nagariensis]|uniref:PsbP C-terminal domain-containing protein n=1 Tax=Volvox carteri f. nagariensis TaxID=3068 RepID=D8TV97_VOLCA|nr:uncharacterized protein VOLCADRAFT_74648 [Volvox carteri f. nagariensis]EFJ48537.1 hypothetical protein VOLCADRAFT_74648 [Volvox carteri f. nagariensis]|eukprot:XP_002950336.1 hypothetical protein VOLCADRAFT_74648 [Volvox carteri f. nagariensis]
MAPIAPSLAQGHILRCPARVKFIASSSSRRFVAPRCTSLRCDQDSPAAREVCTTFARREALIAPIAAAATLAFGARPSQAIQGLIAGRIPGLSKQPDEDGFYMYTRPEGKSGGHGVGWSEIPQYQFKVPKGWDEIPVSIADLGGTEIDLRYQNKEQGDVAVVVAPVLRLIDQVGPRVVKITLREVGPPQRVIEGFAPELFGRPLDEGDVLNTEVAVREDGGLYYLWELKPHNLVAATATKNRVFILTVTSNARQWKKHADELRVIQKSFRVQQEA